MTICFQVRSGIQKSGSGVCGSRVRVHSLWFGVQGVGCGVWGVGLRVED